MDSLKSQKRWRTTLDDDEYVIRGKFGQVALYKNGDLDVWICDWTSTDAGMVRSHRRSVFVEHKGWKAKQHYDDGALFVRPFSDLDRACMFIKAKRKRQVSQQTLERLKAIGYKKEDPAQGGPKLDKDGENGPSPHAGSPGA